jgi:hypothetical protein
MTLKPIIRFGEWTAKKADDVIGTVVRGTTRNSRKMLPSTDGSALKWITSRIAWSFGTSTAKRQVSAAFALMVAAILSTSVGFVGTIVLVFVFAGLAAFGLLRLLIKPVDRAWTSLRDTLIPQG